MAAWYVTRDFSNLVVAVLDNGIDSCHDDLQGNTPTNPNEIVGNGIGDDCNGVVDHVCGTNVVGDAASGEEGID